MLDLLQVAVWEGYAIVFALAAVVAAGLWSGSIRTRGLIEGRNRHGVRFLSGAKAQLLIATLSVASQYIAEVRNDPHHFPDISRNWLLLLGSSHALYLGNKFQGKRQGRFHI